MGGSAEPLTPRIMGYGSGSTLYAQASGSGGPLTGYSGGSGGALPGLSPAEPPSPLWIKPPAPADTSAQR